MDAPYWWSTENPYNRTYSPARKEWVLVSIDDGVASLADADGNTLSLSLDELWAGWEAVGWHRTMI